MSLTTESAIAAYSAGFFDGEGSIHIGAGRLHPLQIQVANTHLVALEWFQSHWGGTLYEAVPNRRMPNASRYWTLYWNSSREQLLTGLLPYLIIKRRAAELALTWLTTPSILVKALRSRPAGSGGRTSSLARQSTRPPHLRRVGNAT